MVSIYISESWEAI